VAIAGSRFEFIDLESDFAAQAAAFERAGHKRPPVVK
jgi:hypothetical protein